MKQGGTAHLTEACPDSLLKAAAPSVPCPAAGGLGVRRPPQLPQGLSRVDWTQAACGVGGGQEGPAATEDKLGWGGSRVGLAERLVPFSPVLGAAQASTPFLRARSFHRPKPSTYVGTTCSGKEGFSSVHTAVERHLGTMCTARHEDLRLRPSH